jgi:hypothetical protein
VSWFLPAKLVQNEQKTKRIWKEIKGNEVKLFIGSLSAPFPGASYGIAITVALILF